LSKESTRTERIKCPLCGYAIFGLPTEHTCPECGFAYDPYTKVIHLSPIMRSMWTISAAIAFAPLGASLVAGRYHAVVAAAGLATGLMLVILTAAYVLISVTLGRRHLLVLNRLGIHWYHKNRRLDTIQWPAFQSVRCDWLGNKVDFMRVDGTIVHSVGRRRFGSRRSVMRCVKEINDRIQVYGSADQARPTD
jgi:hypothetical protein